MLPFYFLCVGISYAIAGDHSSYNPFERLANLADGNYPPPRTRFSRKAERLVGAERSPHVPASEHSVSDIWTEWTHRETRPYAETTHHEGYRDTAL